MTERDPISTPALPGGLPYDASQIQFNPLGTGAVARSVQSKERELLAVADFDTQAHYDAALVAATTVQTGFGAGGGTTNTAVGILALSSDTGIVDGDRGDQNTALGYKALKALAPAGTLTARNNVAVGSHTLEALTIGGQNIGVGNQVLQSLTTGGNNVAVGNASNHDNVSGNDNVSVGVDSLRFNTGTGNTAIGTSALQSQVAGASNTAIGQGAGANNVSGVQGIFIGFSAGRYETVSNTFYLDNTNRGSAAADKAGALFYGANIGTGAVSLQTLQINAVVTKPVHPAFLATATATANATGNATVATVIWGTEIYDQHSDFAANTFTAPVTGRYHFDVTMDVTGLAAGNTLFQIRLIASNRTIRLVVCSAAVFQTAAGEIVISGGTDVDMDAADTVTIDLRVDGGTQIVGYTAGSTFSGHLVC